MRRTLIAGLIAFTSLLGCAFFERICEICEPDSAPEPPAECASFPDLPEQTVVLNDPGLLAEPFALPKTLQTIIGTSGGTSTPADLLASLLAPLNATSFVQPVLGKPIPVQARPAEAGLSPTALLDPANPERFVPTALFNRFDLAPADGSNCGEYRIVYARPSGGRFLLIFEARLPNPAAGQPGTRSIEDCRPVADFWTGLADETPAAAVAQLEQFYFTGMGGGVGPVVTHANYGIPFGQVRSNMFVMGPWQLREYRTSLDAGPPAKPVFIVDTVKDNPLTEWYRPPAALPAGLTPAEQQAFRTHLLDAPICNLLNPDRVDPAATTAEVVNGIGAGFDPDWNEFQSVAQGNADDPAAGADPALVSSLGTRIAQLGASVTAQEALNRAGAMSCGGCHQFSNGRPLGNGHSWPPSAGFVHVTESGTLSPALTATFLPKRRSLLRQFSCDQTVPEPTVASCPPAGAPAAAPSPLQPLPPSDSAQAVDEGVAATLTRGRATPELRQIDDLRLRLLGASNQLTQGREGAGEEAERTQQSLEQLTRRIRAEEQQKPGAFTPVRRTH